MGFQPSWVNFMFSLCLSSNPADGSAPRNTGTQDDRHALAPSFQPILAELNPSSDPFCLYLSVYQ
jgi:hypothetical protein